MSNLRQNWAIISLISGTVLLLLGCRAEQVLKGADCGHLSYNESEFISFRNGPIAGSPPLLRFLAQKDQKIYGLLSIYSAGTCGDCSKVLIARYKRHYELTVPALRHSFQNRTADHGQNLAWNPLAVFQMFKRVRRFLVPLIVTLNEGSEAELALRDKILDEMADLGWPNEEDYQLAASAILRVQFVYDLGTADIANGILDSESTGVTLSASDCNVLGKQAMLEGSYSYAVEWFEEAERRLASPTDLETVDPLDYSVVTNNMELSKGIHDYDFGRSERWDPRLFYSKVSDESADNHRLRRRTNELNLWRGGVGTNFNDINYWGICSGENYQSEYNKSKLFCYLETKSNPYWAINPLKVELLSLTPLLILQYHELMGDEMIGRIKAAVGTNMTRSKVHNGPESVISNRARTSLNTWIDNNKLDEFSFISTKIELITGLKVRSDTASEHLQVASYSAGSHYSVHPDSIGTKEAEREGRTIRPTGERIATFLYYLSDVVKGGKTAFPQSGVASSPIKGSAVLWFNLKKSLELDDQTWHGSCPVILGEKWIANKWILSFDQMFNADHRCTQDPEEVIDMRINGKWAHEFL